MNNRFIDIMPNDDSKDMNANCIDEITLQFGIQSLHPLEIANKFKEDKKFYSVIDFLNLLNDHVKSKNRQESMHKLLDLSDESNPLNDSSALEEAINFEKVINILEILSLANTYPGLSFEVVPIEKQKLTATNLSLLLINKPTPPSKKIKTFNYGYLTMDERNRLVPINTNSCRGKSLVGIWAYGLDFSEYMNSNNTEWVANEASNDAKREDSKSQFLNNPYLWLAWTKFMHDERITKRVSISENRSFIIVHFWSKGTSPQFLEFQMIGNLDRYNKDPDWPPVKHEKAKFISLQNKNPKSESTIKIEKIHKINIVQGESEYMWYKSKAVQKWIKEIYKKSQNHLRNSSKQSLGSGRVSLNTISSLTRHAATIDASQETFQGLKIPKHRISQNIESLPFPSEFQENIHSNIIRTRNAHQFSSLHINSSSNIAQNFKMSKSNTLVKLHPSSGINQNGIGNTVRSSYKNMSQNWYKQLNPKEYNLNSSIGSSKNVDWSDIVLKGDVKPTLKRNFSAVESSLKTLNVNYSINTVSNQIPNNGRYRNEEGVGLSDVFSSKNSPDFNKKYSDWANHQIEISNQKTVINKLEEEVRELKKKLSYYENIWKWAEKKNTKDQSLQCQIDVQQVRKENVIESQETAGFTTNQKKDGKESTKGHEEDNHYYPADSHSIFMLSPDEYESSRIQTKSKGINKNVKFGQIKEFDSQPLNHLNSFEQQRNVFQTQENKNAELDFTLSDVNLQMMKQTPLRRVGEKSPIMSKEETEMLFKTRKKDPTKEFNEEDSDCSYLNYKLINYADKSSITQNSWTKSDLRSAIKIGEDWTIESPKINYYDSDHSSSNDSN